MQIAKHKITPPRPLGYFIQRDRLLSTFDGSDTTGVLVIAPAGYGKTALISQFFDKLPKQMKCWLNLDYDDSAPERFAHYFVGALAATVADVRSSGLMDRARGGMTDLKSLCDDLVLLFDQYNKAPVWFALDNWERVNDSKEICAFVERFLSIPGIKLRLILNSRVKPQMKFRRNQEKGLLRIVEKRTLKFTREELALAVRKRTGSTPEARVVDQFFKLTDGWCVVAGLLKARLAEARFLSDVAELTDLAELQDYLVQEMFNECSHELYDFLVRCSPLDTLSPTGCAAVEQEAARIDSLLAELRDSGIPYSELDSAALRLHPIIAKALKDAFKQNYSREDRIRVCRRIVDYYVAQDDLENAIELLLEIEAYEDALRLIKAHWNTLVFQNKLLAVNQWLSQIPEESQSLPEFILNYIECQHWLGNYQGVIEKAGPLLESGALEHDKDLLGLTWHRYFKCRKAVQSRDLYDEYRESWQQFERHHGPFSPVVLVGIHDMLSYVAFLEYRFNEAAHHTREALSIVDGADPHGSAWYFAQLQFNIHLIGESDTAIKALEEQIESITAASGGQYPAHLASFLAVILTEVGQFEKALAIVRRGQEGLGEIGVFNEHMRHMFMRCEGICLTYLGFNDRGLQTLETALRQAEAVLPPFVRTSAILLNYYRLLADRSIDTQVLPQFKDKPAVSHDYIFGAVTQLYRGVKAGDFVEARRWCDQLIEIVTRCKLEPWIMIISFWHSLIADRLGESEAAKRQLETAVSTFNKLQWQSFPLINSELAAHIITSALYWGIKISHGDELMRFCSRRDLSIALSGLLQRESATESQQARLVEWAARHKIVGLSQAVAPLQKSRDQQLARSAAHYVETEADFPLLPLYVGTLGPLSVNVDGRSVEFERKKSKLLFAVLLANHPGAVHEEALLDTLLAGKQVRRPLANIRTIASSLRNSLQGAVKSSSQYIEYEDGMYRLNLPKSSFVDVAELDSLYRIATGAALAPGEVKEEDARRITDVLDLYREDFLPEYRYEAFATEVRERVRAQYLQLSAFAVEYLIDKKKYQLAEKYLLAGLEREPIWTDGIELAIRLFKLCGQTIKGIKAYQKYVKNLKQELDVGPSKKLQELFQSSLE